MKTHLNTDDNVITCYAAANDGTTTQESERHTQTLHYYCYLDKGQLACKYGSCTSQHFWDEQSYLYL
jgi:hypothetical protein